MHIIAQTFLTKLRYSYVDVIILIWLIIGLIRGRKLGMSQELLPVLQWIAIVALASQFYRPFSLFIRQNTPFSMLWSNITGYMVIALVLKVIFMSLKKAVGEKLVGSDVFGGSEYYMGMFAGIIRFACMVIVVYALMNSRVYTDAELAQDAKDQRQSFEDISFPTYMSIQHAALFESLIGRSIKTYLRVVLITPINGASGGETIKQKKQAAMDEILGAPPPKPK